MKMKLLSLLLAISLLAGLLPATIASAETTAATTPSTAATTAPTTAATTAPTTAATTAPTTAATTAPTTAPTTTPTTAATTPSVSLVHAVSVKLCETGTNNNYAATLTVAKGGDPVYAITNDTGSPTVVTDGSAPSNYYVKFEYPQDDLPTLTLMNAKLRASGNVVDLSSLDTSVKIVIAGNSTIESTTKCGIFRASHGDIIITGPKKLTMNCYSSVVAFEGDPYANSLILKNLPLVATTAANVASRAIQIPAGNLIVDGSSVSITNRAGLAVYLSQGNGTNAVGLGNAIISDSVFSATSKNIALQLSGDLTVANSNMQLTSDNYTLYCNGDLTAKNSTLVMTGSSDTIETMNVDGEFSLHATNAEVIGLRYKIFNGSLPRLIGEYTVIAGLDKDNSDTYDEELVGTYYYFYAESIEEPTNPEISDNTETDPTGDFTEPTLYPPTEPTEAPTQVPTDAATTATTTPSNPADSAPKKNNSTLFWILAVLMVLGAGGAAALAILMIRKNAEEAFDEEFEDPETEEVETEEIETTEAEAEEVAIAEPEEVTDESLDEESQENTTA